MSNLSKEMEPYKEAAIEFIKSNDFEYNDLNECLVIVEPDVLLSDERVMWGGEMLDSLDELLKSSSEYDDYDVLLDYVEFCDLVKPLDKHDLIERLVNTKALRELEAKYSYALNLFDRLRRELPLMEYSDIHDLARNNPYLTVNRQTLDVEFAEDEPDDEEEYDCFDTADFIRDGSDYDDPENNIFCGYLFCNAPISQVSREEVVDYFQGYDDADDGDISNGLPF